MRFGECDCCQTSNRRLHGCLVTGIDTVACTVCVGGALSDDIEDIEDEIESLLASKPETAELWAHICSLEAALVEARRAA